MRGREMRENRIRWRMTGAGGSCRHGGVMKFDQANPPQDPEIHDYRYFFSRKNI
jgi:hypothetical protein